MILGFLQTHHVAQALAANLFTWLMTLLGSTMVFFFRSIKTGMLDFMLGFAAGVMIAASFWSSVFCWVGYFCG
jgi:ZIP family zinc transporter